MAGLPPRAPPGKRRASGGRGAEGRPDPPISSRRFRAAAKAPPPGNAGTDCRFQKIGNPRARLKKITKKTLRWGRGGVRGLDPCW